MENSFMVGKEVVKQGNEINPLQKSAGENASLKPKEDFQRRPHRPARYRLLDKNGIPHGTYKDSTEAYKQAEEMKLGDPNTSDDDDTPNGWYLESTKVKASKRPRRARVV